MQIKILNVEQMKTVEQEADANGHPYAEMMERAGQAVAERILLNLPTDLPRPPRIVVLAGAGNNGGDGLVAARVVKVLQPQAEVSVYLLKPREDDLVKNAREVGVFIVDAENDTQNRVLKNTLAGADVLVDALIGTGGRLPLEDNAAKLLRAVGGVLTRRAEAYPKFRALDPTQDLDADPSLTLDHMVNEIPDDATPRPRLIAVDCPSGMDCDTGETDKNILRADETVTFGAAKRGHFCHPAADYVGHLYVADIGIPDKTPSLKAVKISLLTGEDVAKALPPRPSNAHKGTFGKVFVVAGSVNYIGAAYLAGGAAYRIGAGLVTLGVPQMLLTTLAGLLPEATWTLLPNDMGVINKAAAPITREEAAGYDALLVGCGIGDEDETRDYMQALLQPENAPSKKATSRRIGLLTLDAPATSDEKEADAQGLPPLIIDADGLNALAKLENWPKLLPKDTILTPHPKEFARLAGLDSTETVQADRLGIASKYAQQWKAIVVLKGAYTVIAHPDGRAALSPFATPTLATAGTGDVLAGAIAGLRAQGLDAYQAAQCGVWLHGWAGAYGVLGRGALASEVMLALSEALATVGGA
jgi:NAD(P)H-hydrate epimerase